MKASTTIRYGVIIIGLMVVLSGVWGGQVKYFADDSMRNVCSPNNPPSQAMFFSGEHNRTYVTYGDSNFNASIACYDHDTGKWIGPVAVDDLRYDDGHNTPELLVTGDGYLHLFYGCHGDPIKYARSLYPEDITRWRLGKDIGFRGTYPSPVQLANGDILLFYRYSKVGWHCPLKVHRSTDNGSTWDEGTEILEFSLNPEQPRYSGACYIRGILYDAVRDRLYLAVTEALRDSPEMVAGKVYPRMTAYSAQYDPVSGHVIAMNGVDLGTKATKEELDANDCCKALGFVQLGRRVVTLHKPWTHTFGMYTPDGVHFLGFKTRDNNLVVGKSSDGGQTWDDGQVIVTQADVDGDPIGGATAIVRNYAGSGPLVIFEGRGDGATPEFLRRYEARQKYNITPILLSWRKPPWHKGWNHYRVPWRQRKRLYAVDQDWQLVTNRIGEAGH